VVLEDMPPESVDKITHRNAMRWYSFDPFAVRAREDSTVGALRRAADGHDVSIRSLDTGRHEKRAGIEIGELAQRSIA
jgi:hypothetical protein